MKSYDETINTVFDRISEYKTAQKRKKKIITRTVVPACSVVLAAAIGIGVWQSDIFKSKPSVSLDDSTVIGEKDYIEPNDLDNFQKEQTSSSNDNSTSETDTQSNDFIDVIGMVKVNGVNYVQCSTNNKVYTPDEYLGNACDFEGTYQTYLSDIAAELYIAKEDPNVLMVELKRGEYVDYVILIREE